MIIIHIDDIGFLTGMGRSTVYSYMRRGLFPRQVKIGSRSGWLLEEVIAWIKRKMDDRDQPPSPPDK
jgi:prophage regulatory protein